jgi:ribonuclease HII
LPDFSLERQFPGIVIGVDEAGRGPLAGPVVAAAVVLERPLPRKVARLIDDSKQLDAEQRARAYEAFQAFARIAVAAASVAEIDRLNILRASHLAMVRAVERLALVPDCVLVDGNMLPPLKHKMQAVIGGDAKSLSIAAASIVAKLIRDRLMARLGNRYPAFGWQHNMGYSTEEHQIALEKVGVTRHHRRSFQPVGDLFVGVI